MTQIFNLEQSQCLKLKFDLKFEILGIRDKEGTILIPSDI